MTYLITGGLGFLGSNIAERLINQGESVVIVDNFFRRGSEKNYDYLNSVGKFEFRFGDIRNRDDIFTIVKSEKPKHVFHLAGQVAMTTSIDRPYLDFEINALGSLNLIEALKEFSPEASLIYSSTNKVYGDFEWINFKETETRYYTEEFPNGFPEEIPLNFSTPYGCSKGSADQYIKDAYKMWGLKTVVFRHSSMFGINQHSTFDQGWIGWFCQKAIEQKSGVITPFTISGSGKQVRDVLFSEDAVDVYIQASEQIEKIKGKAFNIGGGMENSLSLLELFELLEKELNTKLDFSKLPERKSDQKVFVADTSGIKSLIGWTPKIDKLTGVQKMLEWISISYRNCS